MANTPSILKRFFQSDLCNHSFVTRSRSDQQRRYLQDPLANCFIRPRPRHALVFYRLVRPVHLLQLRHIKVPPLVPPVIHSATSRPFWRMPRAIPARGSPSVCAPLPSAWSWAPAPVRCDRNALCCAGSGPPGKTFSSAPSIPVHLSPVTSRTPELGRLLVEQCVEHLLDGLPHQILYVIAQRLLVDRCDVRGHGPCHLRR